jgi:hypothetical protein
MNTNETTTATKVRGRTPSLYNFVRGYLDKQTDKGQIKTVDRLESKDFTETINALTTYRSAALAREKAVIDAEVAAANAKAKALADSAKAQEIVASAVA